MKITVKYFASIREAMGKNSEPMDTSATTLAGLRDALIAEGEPYAQSLARGKTLRMAQNQVMADETDLLLEGAEIAFFPPVTGG
jgi:sulfur-carrier protein